LCNSSAKSTGHGKSYATAFLILEKTIGLFDRKGIDFSNLNEIGTHIGVPAATLKYYFVDIASLKITTFQYIRVCFQKLAIQEMQKCDRADDKLKKYVESCFTWLSRKKQHRRVWFRFIAACGFDPSFRDLNTKAVQAGTVRVSELLILGQNQGVFNFKNARLAARQIQSAILGALFSLHSENELSLEKYIESMIDLCLQAVNYNHRG